MNSKKEPSDKPGQAPDGEEDEVARAELLKLLSKHSKLIRELAISRRIDTAEKVTVEEFYDTKAEAKLGAKADLKKGLDLSLGGGGEHVTRRVYTFEGWRDGGLDAIAKLFPELYDELQKETGVAAETEIVPNPSDT